MKDGQQFVLSAHYGSRWGCIRPWWQDENGRWSNEFPDFEPFVLTREPRSGEIVASTDQLFALFDEGRVDEIPFPVRFRRTRGTKLGDLLQGTGRSTLVSDRFVEVLRELEIPGWRTFDLEIEHPRGEPLTGYQGFIADSDDGEVRTASWMGEIVVSARVDEALRAAGVTAYERHEYLSDEPDELGALRLDALDPLGTDWVDPRPAELVTGVNPDWMLEVTPMSDAALWVPAAPDQQRSRLQLTRDLAAGKIATQEGVVSLHRAKAIGVVRDVMTAPEAPLFIVSDRFHRVLDTGDFSGWFSHPVELIDGDEHVTGFHLLWAHNDPDGIHDVTGMEQVDVALRDILPDWGPGEHEIAGSELWEEVRAHTRWVLPEPRHRFIEISPHALAALRAAGVTDFEVRPSPSRSAQWADLERVWNDPECAVTWNQ